MKKLTGLLAATSDNVPLAAVTAWGLDLGLERLGVALQALGHGLFPRRFGLKCIQAIDALARGRAVPTM